MLTEDRFKDLLNAELDASPGPPMPGIAERAAAGGRRRARRRSVAAAVGTALAVGLVAGGITVASTLGPHGASVAGPAAQPSATTSPGGAVALGGDPRLPAQPVPDNPLAAQVRPVIEQLLPGGTKTTKVATGSDGGIYATVEWQTGKGQVEVVVGLVGKQWFGCQLVDGKPTPVEGNYGQCVLTKNGTLVGTYGGTNGKTGLQNRLFETVTGGTMVTLSYANGAISDGATPTQPDLPLTDEQGIAILTNDAWQPLLAQYVPLPPAPNSAPTPDQGATKPGDLPPLTTAGSQSPPAAPPTHG